MAAAEARTRESRRVAESMNSEQLRLRCGAPEAEAPLPPVVVVAAAGPIFRRVLAAATAAYARRSVVLGSRVAPTGTPALASTSIACGAENHSGSKSARAVSMPSRSQHSRCMQLSTPRMVRVSSEPMAVSVPMSIGYSIAWLTSPFTGSSGS